MAFCRHSLAPIVVVHLSFDADCFQHLDDPDSQPQPESNHPCNLAFRDMGKDAQGRSGRKAQEKIIKKEGSARTDRNPEIETDVDSSYELQIKQISTCWKHHSESFPTSTYTSLGGG